MSPRRDAARPWPAIGATVGVVLAVLAGQITVRAGASWPVVAQDHLVGLAYVLAGTIAWQRRPGNPVGPLLLAVGCTWYIPDRRLRDRAWPDGIAVKIRLGLHGGEAQRTTEGYVGLDVHRASRIGSAGHGAQTLLSQSARDRLGAELPRGATCAASASFA